MSERRDSYDFLGWAPDLGFWDSPAEPSVINPAPRPVTTPPPAVLQQVARQPAPARPAPPRRPSPPPESQRPGRPSMSKAIVPLLVAFAAMCIVTLMTALSLAFQDTGSPPVPLLVCLAITIILGRFAWVTARR